MNCLNPIRRNVEYLDFSTGETSWHPIYVPCGRCTNCFASDAFNWFFRLKAEYRACRNCHFLTLTFDDRHLPKGFKNGKDEFQKFLKRLRKNYQFHKYAPNFRYYAITELGGSFGRLHLHAIFFDSPWQNLYTAWSNYLKTWNNGIVRVSEVNDNRISYVTKYIYQQENRPVAEYIRVDNHNFRVQEPNFFQRFMSKGIGMAFLTPEMVRYLRDRGDGTLMWNGKERALPSYYLDKVWSGEHLGYIKMLRLKKLIDEYEEEHTIQLGSRSTGRTSTSSNPDVTLLPELRDKLLQRKEKARRIEKHNKKYQFKRPPSLRTEQNPYAGCTFTCLNPYLDDNTRRIKEEKRLAALKRRKPWLY